MFASKIGQMNRLLFYAVLVVCAYGCVNNCQQQNTGYVKFINPSNHTFDCIINGTVCARIGPNDSLVHSPVPTGQVSIGFQKVGLEMNTTPVRTKMYQINTCDTALALAQPYSGSFAMQPCKIIACNVRPKPTKK